MHAARIGVVACAFLVIASLCRAVPGDMVFYYTLDDGQGGTIKDSSGNGRDGRVQGAVKAVDGKFGKAAEVGAADEIQIDDDGSLDGMKAFTAEMWVYMETQQATGLIQKGTDWGANMSYLIQPWSDGKIYFGIKETASRAITNPGDFPLKKWFHLAATYDGSLLKLYIDGKKMAEAPPPAGVKEVPDTKDALKLGGRFAGQMDEAVFYKRALSDAEIQLDMQGRVLAVEPAGKAATTWADVKAR